MKTDRQSLILEIISQENIETQEQLLARTAGNEDAEDEVYGELLDTERELSKYVPIEMNALDETYDMEEMDKALAALQEYKKLLD